MINPYLVETWRQKITLRSSGAKYYFACFGFGNWAQVSRKRHKTASEALAYGNAVTARWRRLYDFGIVAMLPEGMAVA